MSGTEETIDNGWRIAQRQRSHPGRFRSVLRDDSQPTMGVSLPLVFLAGLAFEGFFGFHEQRVAELALNLVTVLAILTWTLVNLRQRTLPWRDPVLIGGCLLLTTGAGGCLLGLFHQVIAELFLKTLGTILILFALDRMERKRILQVVSNSEEYLESIFESIPDPLLVIGEGRRVIAGNRVALSAFGNEVLGRNSCTDILRHRDCTNCAVTEVWERKKPRFEIVRGDDGGRRYEVTTFPLFGRDGFAGRLIQQVRDVSSQSQTEDDASIFHDALNSVKDAVLITDLRGNLLHNNRKAESLIGVDPLGAEPRSAFELLPFKHDRDREAFLQALRAWSPWEREVELAHPRSPDRTVILLLAPIRAMDDRLLGSIVLVRDVTQVKSLQGQLVQNEKLSALGGLVSGVSHELNNPLTAVYGFAQVLLTEDLDENVRGQVEHIFNHAERCRKIIEGLLRFSRSHQSKRQPSNLNEVVRGASELLGYQLKLANVKVALDLSPGMPDSMMEPIHLQQVLINLVTNAQHAIEAADVEGLIKIRTKTGSEHNMILEVEDNGGGMPESVRGRIFDPFFTTKGIGKGTGLGLALAYGTVQDHGGKIEVSSEVGVGTTFRIDLPIMEPVLSKEPQTDSNLCKQVVPRRILVVDDEPVILELLTQILRSDGHEVVTSEDGGMALREAQQRTFDLVFTDWRMPGMGGDEFYEALRERHPELRGRVVFITGDSLDTEVVEAAKRDGNALLNKPFTIESIREALAKLDSKGPVRATSVEKPASPLPSSV